MLLAVHAGGGTMAQFSIPELGGSGQWMRGGMTMVGNMFDNALKARVDALCSELAQLIATTTVFPASTRGLPDRVHLGQLVAGRPRRSELVRRTERRALRDLPEHPAAGDPDQRRHKGFRHRRAPDRWRATAAGRRIRLGELHQPVRHLRRIEPDLSSVRSRWPRLLPPHPPRSPSPTRPAHRPHRPPTQTPAARIRRVRGSRGHHHGHRVAGRAASARHPLRRGVRREEGRTARPALRRYRTRREDTSLEDSNDVDLEQFD